MLTEEQLLKAYGSPVWQEAGGLFVPLPVWCAKWLDRLVPSELAATELSVGVTIHTLVADSFLDVMDELDNVEYRVKQLYSWSPRHIMMDRSRGLSKHAFGFAVDVNWDDNEYGTEGDMPPEFVAVWERNGWVWGGRWKTKDPMHFEYGRIP